MVGIQTQAEYNDIVKSLAEEYADAINDNATRDVASGVIASFDVLDTTPVIGLTVTVWGEEIESIDEALLPSEVLLFTDSSVQNTDRDTTRTDIAITALTTDLEQTHSQTLLSN